MHRDRDTPDFGIAVKGLDYRLKNTVIIPVIAVQQAYDLAMTKSQPEIPGMRDSRLARVLSL